MEFTLDTEYRQHQMYLAQMLDKIEEQSELYKPYKLILMMLRLNKHIYGTA